MDLGAQIPDLMSLYPSSVVAALFTNQTMTFDISCTLNTIQTVPWIWETTLLGGYRHGKSDHLYQTAVRGKALIFWHDCQVFQVALFALISRHLLLSSCACDYPQWNVSRHLFTRNGVYILSHSKSCQLSCPERGTRLLRS
jgi:hypothetical protein